MKVNYILSDTTKNATSVALSKVIEKAEQNVFGNFVVIVPETKSIIIEKELLKLSSSKAFANIYVYSFVRLLKRLGFVPEEKIVTKPASVLLLRKIILLNQDQLVCYKKTAKTIGFAEKMYETIAQFKSSGVVPADLKNLNNLGSASLKAKLADIAFIYEQYEQALGEDLFDDLDKLALLSTFAKTNRFLKDAELFVVGFDNITFEMGEVLKDLAKNSKEITFSSVYFNEQRGDKHIQSNELFNRLKHIADDLKIPYEPEFVKTRHDGDFSAIANFLFRPKINKVKPAGNISVFEASSKKRELDYVANMILSEVKNGKRFKDVGVLVCDLESNTKVIKNCFQSYGIPYFVNEDYDVSSHVYMKFLMNAFEMMELKLLDSKVLEFVANPFFDDSGFADFQNYVNEFGINRKAFLEIPKNIEFENNTVKENVVNVCSKFASFVKEFENRLKKSKTFADYVNQLEFVSKFFKAEEYLEKLTQKQAELGFVVESQISSQMFEKVSKFAKLATNFLGQTEVSIDEFVLLFKSGFASVKANVVPVSIDSVVVQNSTDGFFDIKDLFIVGAEEGKFPSKLQDTGVILDAELEETKMLISKAIEPSVKEINKRENFKVYEALLEPKEKLFVSYSLKDLAGASQTPARVVDKLKGLFGEEIFTKTYQSVGFVSAKNEELKFARRVNKFLSGDDETVANLNKTYSLIAHGLSPEFKKFLDEYGLSKGKFEIENASDLYFKNGKTSISQLEKYFACPYLFFADYGLRLKENKKSKLSSLDIGNLIHRVAELFMKDLGFYQSLEKNEFDQKIKALFEFVLEEQNVKRTKNNAILNLVFDEAKRLCCYILNEQSNSSFKVECLEFEFKAENSVKLCLENGSEIVIEGKIDRIDKWKNYIRIIDYKTGDIKSDLKSVFLGEKIQLVSYLSAMTNDTQNKVAGVFYLPIHSEYEKDEKKLMAKYKMEGFILSDSDIVKNMDHNLSFENPDSKFVPIKIKTNKTLVNENRFEMYAQEKALDEEEFEALKNYCIKLCSKAVDEILQGNNEPAPLEKNGKGLYRCEYCNYAGFCGLENSRFAEGRRIDTKITKENFNKNQG